MPKVKRLKDGHFIFLYLTKHKFTAPFGTQNNPTPMAGNMEEVLRQIHENKQTKSKILDLSGLGLTKLPDRSPKRHLTPRNLFPSPHV